MAQAILTAGLESRHTWGPIQPPILDVLNAKDFCESETVGRLCEANKLADSGFSVLQVAGCTMQIIDTRIPMPYAP